MNWHIFTIGKPKLGYVNEAAAEYAQRLRHFAGFKIEPLKAAGGSEGDALLQRSEGMLRIVLDERGEQVSSRELSARVGKWEQSGTKNIAVLIGGADGHAPEVREAADWLWSLSRLTLQHELSLIVALEQIYRAYTIKSGLPYHRD